MTPFALSDRGNAFVELAIILPILLLAVIGSVDFGRELREHTIVVEAARIGARSAGMLSPGTSSSTVTQSAVDAASTYLQRAGYTPGHYRFNVDPRSITLTRTGAVALIRLNINRRQDAPRWMLGGAKFIDSNVVTAFALAPGNTAEPRSER